MIITLTGFMGCGKSSVGRRLSALLSCSFTDLDSAVEERYGRSVPEIFSTDGEAAFRLMELDTLNSLVADHAETVKGENGQEVSGGHLVLSLGGGTVMTPRCAELVQGNTLCIYLKASADTLVSRLEGEAAGRPLLSSVLEDEENIDPKEALRRRIIELMDKRSSTYENTAHIIIDTDGRSIDQIAREIISYHPFHACP